MHGSTLVCLLVALAMVATSMISCTCSSSPPVGFVGELSLYTLNCDYGACDGYISGVVKNYTNSTRDVDIDIDRYSCSVRGGGEATYQAHFATDTVLNLKPNEERKWVYRLFTQRGFKWLDYYNEWHVKIGPSKWHVGGRMCE